MNVNSAKETFKSCNIAHTCVRPIAWRCSVDRLKESPNKWQDSYFFMFMIYMYNFDIYIFNILSIYNSYYLSLYTFLYTLTID